MIVNDALLLNSRLHSVCGGVGFLPFQINAIYSMDIGSNILLTKPKRMCGATTIIALMSVLKAMESNSASICIMSMNNALAMYSKSFVLKFLHYFGYETDPCGPFGITLVKNKSSIFFCSPGLGSARVIRSVISSDVISALFIDELCYFHQAHFNSFIELTRHSSLVFCVASQPDISKYYENLFPIVDKPVIIL